MKIDSIQTTIRNKLAREVREYGVRAMADRIGWFHANISNWLCGKTPIPQDRAEAICGVLGYTMTINAIVTFEEIECPAPRATTNSPAKPKPLKKRKAGKRKAKPQPGSPTGPTVKSPKQQRRA